MYDKYSTANPFPIGSKISKHKAILFSGATGLAPNIDVHLIQGGCGATFTAKLFIDSSPYIFPMEVYAIPSALPTGVTAYYLN